MCVCVTLLWIILLLLRHDPDPTHQPQSPRTLPFARYWFSSRLLYKNQHYYWQTPPGLGKYLPPPSAPTLMRNLVFSPDNP